MTHIVDPTLRPLAIKVYAAICEAHNDWDMSPSQVELRDACLCSMPTVRQALKVLKAKGYITQQKFGVRSVRPTDPQRTISRESPKPWEELEEPQKFFKPPVKRLTNK